MSSSNWTTSFGWRFGVAVVARWSLSTKLAYTRLVLGWVTVYWFDSRGVTINERTCSLIAICHRPSSVCLVVYLPVCNTRVVYRTQTVEIFGNISTAFVTLAIRWYTQKILWRSSPGNPSTGGVKRGVSNIAIFDLSRAISRKWCKIGGKLVLITNRKSHMSFDWWPWMAWWPLFFRYFT